MTLFPSAWQWAGAAGGGGLPAGGRRAFSGQALAARRASNAFPVDGLGFSVQEPNIARYDAQGFLVIEGQRQNLVTNPRFEGGPATPTGHSYTGRDGVSIGTFGFRSVGDLPVFDINPTGTATGNGWLTHVFTNPVPVEQGDWISFSFIANVELGGGLNSSGTFYFSQRDASNAVLGSDQSRGFTPTPGLPFGEDRFTWQWQATQAGVAQVSHYWRYRFSSGSVVGPSNKYSLAAPQIEKNGAATSLILPPVGAPAVSTRAEDRVRMDVPAQGAAAVRCRVPAVPRAGEANHILFQVDDGTDANRIVLWVEPGGALNALAVIDGGFTFMGSLGTVTADQVLDLVLRWTSSGATAHREGQAAAGHTAIPAGIGTLRFGNRADWGQGANLRLGKVDAYPELSLLQVPAAFDALKRMS